MDNVEVRFAGSMGEPVERTTKLGKPWLAFPVYTRDGQRLDVALFDDLAVQLKSEIRNGRTVYVEGTLRLNVYAGVRAYLNVTPTTIRFPDVEADAPAVSQRATNAKAKAGYARPLDVGADYA